MLKYRDIIKRRNSMIDLTKRRMLKVICVLGIAGIYHPVLRTKPLLREDREYVLYKGWILKRNDLDALLT